jgi:hypothetical protein
MDGDVSSGMFNSPSAVVFYNSTTFPNVITEELKPIVLKNNTIECIYSTLANNTDCIDNMIYANNDTDLDPNKVKLYYPTLNQTSNSYNYQVLYYLNSYYL